MTRFFAALGLTTAFILVALLVGKAYAGTPKWGYEDMRLNACSLHTLKSEPVPGRAMIRKINVWADGAQISGEAVGGRRAEWIGRGVAVVVQLSARTAPLVFRVANLNTRRCTRVRITYRWTLS